MVISLTENIGALYKIFLHDSCKFIFLINNNNSIYNIEISMVYAISK